MVLLILELIAIVGVTVLYGQRANQWDQDLQQIQPKAQQVRDIKTAADQLTAEATPLAEWVKFSHDVDQHDADYARVLEAINNYLHPKAALKSLEIKEDTLTMTVNVDKPETAGQCYLNLKRCDALINLAVTSKMPGWSGQEWGGWQRVSDNTGTSSSTGPVPGQAIVVVTERRGFDVTFSASLSPKYSLKPPAPPGGEPTPTTGGEAGAGSYPAPVGGAGPMGPGGMPPPAAPGGPEGPVRG